jgi:hypothetical protein
MREARTALAEVDYVIAQGQHIVPVEIKAGKSGTLKSLHIFLKEKHRRFGLRFNAAPPGLLRDASLPGCPGQRGMTCCRCRFTDTPAVGRLLALVERHVQ